MYINKFQQSLYANQDFFLGKIKRRFLTIPIFIFFFLVNLFFLPFSLFLLLLVDVILRKNFVFCRCLIFLILFLFYGVVGLFRAYLSWLFYTNDCLYFILDDSKIKKLWAYNIFFSAQKLFSISVKMKGFEGLKSNDPVFFL